MSLFKTSVTIHVVVEADDEDHAEDVARNSYREAVNNAPSCDSIWTKPAAIVSEGDLPDTRDRMCIPYGGDRNTRIGALLGDPQ